MLRIEKILFTTDFSKFSQRALSHVAFWSARFGCEIHVLHVAKRQKNVDEVLSKMAQVSKLLTREYCRFLGPGNCQIRLVPVHVVGIDPADEIIKYAHQEKMDLIIQTTHGRSGFRRFFLGSVAEKVVSHSRCGVLTVRQPLAKVGEAVHRILVPTDLKETAPALIDHAVGLGRVFQSEIHLLHVLEDTSSVILHRTGRKSWLEHQTVKLDQAFHHLEQLARHSKYEKLFLEVKKGNVLTEIEKSTNSQAIDLILISTTGQLSQTASPLGSVAQGVINNIDSQIFTIPSYGKSLLEKSATG